MSFFILYCILLKNDSLLRILRFPGYFETPLFRTFFLFPWDFEIAGSTVLRFLFSILDTEPPTCGFCPPNKLIDNATALNIRVNWPRANCSDNSGQNPVITSNRLSGDLFAVPGVYEVVYTVTDQQNNVNRNCSFRITLKSKYLSIRSFVSLLRNRA